MEVRPTATAGQIKKENGQRDARSVVGVQLNWTFPERLWLFGKSGEGRIIFPASRIRLSQKISSALLPAIVEGRLLEARFPSADTGKTNLSVPKLGLLASEFADTVPIRSETLITSASSVLLIFSTNGPTSRMSPEARASFSSTALPFSCI